MVAEVLAHCRHGVHNIDAVRLESLGLADA